MDCAADSSGWQNCSPAGHQPGSRFIGLLALCCLTFGYLLVLGGESTPRPASRAALGFVTSLVVLLGVVATAAVVPVVVVAAAFRSSRDAASPPVGLNVTPPMITFSLGATTFLLGLVFFAVTMWASPPQWRLVAMVAVLLGSPLLLIPFWTYTYQRLLSRWEVALRTVAIATGVVPDTHVLAAVTLLHVAAERWGSRTPL